MESILISGNSKKDIHLLATIAEKMGMDVSVFNGDDLEDFILAKAIKEGKTGELIDADAFLKSIQN